MRRLEVVGRLKKPSRNTVCVFVYYNGKRDVRYRVFSSEPFLYDSSLHGEEGELFKADYGYLGRLKYWGEPEEWPARLGSLVLDILLKNEELRLFFERAVYEGRINRFTEREVNKVFPQFPLVVELDEDSDNFED